jgi:hypothetical protein
LAKKSSKKNTFENVLTMCQLCVGSSERKTPTVYICDKEQSMAVHNQPIKTTQFRIKFQSGIAQDDDSGKNQRSGTPKQQTRLKISPQRENLRCNKKQK